MHRLLVHYCVDVQHPGVSGAEHLEMLQSRDRLAELEPMLISDEQEALAEADRVLVERAAAFYQELIRFLDLATYRREHSIQPARWWWYLDVVSHLPPFKDEAPDVKRSGLRRPYIRLGDPYKAPGTAAYHEVRLLFASA